MRAASPIAVYLDDEQDIARAAKVMKGWLGDRSSYPGIPGPHYGPEDAGRGFHFGGSEEDLSWQADPSRPRGVNPKGAEKEGHSIDGALPDDMRRGGSFTWPPEHTQYPREALSGYVPLAELLHRQGYDVYAWQNKALLRADPISLRPRARGSGGGVVGAGRAGLLDRQLPLRDVLSGRRTKGWGGTSTWTDWTHAPG